MLFGQRRNKKFLIAFLNALLMGRKVIKDLIYLDKEQLGLLPQNRKSVFDVYCEDENGDRFIIEIQRNKVLFLTNRTVFYSAYPIIEQGVRGNWDHKLKEIYNIWILDHIFTDNDLEKMIHEVKLVETETGHVFDNSLTYLYVEAPKFTKTESELETPLDKWMFVLNNLSKLDQIPVTLRDDPIFKEFFMVAELLRMTHEEREAYLVSLKQTWDEYSLRQTALIEGKAEGIAEAKTAIAMEMKKLQVDFSVISQSTGLTIREIQML